MPEQNHLRHVQAPTPHRPKRIGGYLVEAGLLTPAQVDVVLNDQRMTGMRFGEILAARGWVKQQTIEFLMEKVILPEQETLRQIENGAVAEMGRSKLDKSVTVQSCDIEAAPGSNRTPHIAKPLPAVSPKDDEVGWVG